MSKTISKKMLINVIHPEEARVAIVHDGRLMELNIEITGKEQTKGNIYKGIVLRVEPGLQAALLISAGPSPVSSRWVSCTPTFGNGATMYLKISANGVPASRRCCAAARSCWCRWRRTNAIIKVRP